MTVYAIFAILLALAGMIGSVIPGIPGPPLAWIGLLLVQLGGADVGTALYVYLGITIVITVLDYTLPALLTSWSGGSKAGVIGSIIGLFVGIFFTEIGIILGSLLGAFIGELIHNSNSTGNALKAALGNFAGFVLTTGLKLTLCVLMMLKIILELKDYYMAAA
ncbi:MAG: DUF456 domain-containing protein [Bacteroidales bacterium]|nr:DUF456 domain-containing protein [Bacteroidales bacterium]